MVDKEETPAKKLPSMAAKYLNPGECPQGHVTVRVSTKVPLPFIITRREGTFIFQPDANLPEEIAKALIAGNKELYSLAGEDKVDMRAYTFTKDFETKQLQDVVNRLSRQNQLKIFKLAKEMLTEEEKES